jgi:hypothetical protein
MEEQQDIEIGHGAFADNSPDLVSDERHGKFTRAAP